MGSINVHTHFIPQTYLDGLAAQGITQKEVGFKLEPWNADKRIALMDRNDIDVEMLSLSSPSMRFWKGEAAVSLTRKLNDELAGIVRDRPKRFGGFATLALPNVDAALAEIDYIFDQLGLDGVVLMTNYEGVYLGDPKFAPVLDELNRRKAVLFVHPTEGPSNETLTQGFPAPAFEYPADTTRTVVSLIDNNTVTRCPDLKIIVSHGGGTIPFMVDRLQVLLPWKWKGDPKEDAARIKHTIDSLYYDLAIVCYPAPLTIIKMTHDVSRMLTGYDQPFVPEKDIVTEHNNFEMFDGFTDKEKAAIRSGNAQSLFARLCAQ